MLHRPPSLTPLLGPQEDVGSKKLLNTTAAREALRRKNLRGSTTALDSESPTVRRAWGTRSGSFSLLPSATGTFTLEEEPEPGEIPKKSSLYERFLAEIASRAVLLPPRPSGDTFGRFPQPLHSTPKGQTTAGPATARTRPSSAVSSLASGRRLLYHCSTDSESPPIAANVALQFQGDVIVLLFTTAPYGPPSSRATLHHLAPVVMVDGTKQGLFIGVRAQVDTSRAPRADARVGPTRVNLVQGNIFKIFRCYAGLMADAAKLHGLPPSFEAINKAQSGMCLAESQFLLRDLGLIPCLLTRTEARAVFVSTVACVTGALEKDQFGEFLVRIALCLDPAQLQLLSSPVPSAEDSPLSESYQPSIPLGGLGLLVEKERPREPERTESSASDRILQFVQLLQLNDSVFVRRFLTEVSKDSASRFQLMRSAYPPKAYDRAQTQESSLLGLALTARGLTFNMMPLRDSSERPERLAASTALYDRSLCELLLKGPRVMGKLPTSGPYFQTLPVWHTNDDVFFDMSNLQAGQTYMYRLLVVNTGPHHAQITAEVSGLPDWVALTYSPALFAPGVTNKISIVCKPTAGGIECLGFIDINSCCPSQSPDIETIRCPVYIHVLG